MTYSIPTILAASQTVSVQPGAPYATIRCPLSAPMPGPGFVKWTTEPGSAKEGQDFVHSSGEILLREGDTVAQCTVPLLKYGGGNIHTGPMAFGVIFQSGGGVTGEMRATVNLNARTLVLAADLSAAGLAAATTTGLSTTRAKGARTLLGFGGDTESGEAGLYRPGLAKVGSDGRAHLTCAPLPAPVVEGGKTYTTAMSLLLYDGVFSPGTLVEHDMQVHEMTSAWPATWTAADFGWPNTGEVDFPELRADWTPPGSGLLNIQQHCTGYAGAGTMQTEESVGLIIPGFDYAKLHHYELEWTADDVITGRIDGVEVYRQPMMWDGSTHGVMLQCAAYAPLVAGKYPDVSWSYCRVWK